MTAGQLVDRVLLRLDENTASPVFWSRAEILAWVNDGLNEINLLAMLRYKESGDTEATGRVMTCPDDAVAPLAILFDDESIDRVLLEDMDRSEYGWEAKSGNPRRWMPLGGDRVMLWPRPDLPNTMIKFIYLEQTDRMAEGDTIDLEAEHIEAVERYAFHHARLKEGGRELQSAMPQWNQFLSKTAGIPSERLGSLDSTVEIKTGNTYSE